MWIREAGMNNWTHRLTDQVIQLVTWHRLTVQVIQLVTWGTYPDVRLPSLSFYVWPKLWNSLQSDAREASAAMSYLNVLNKTRFLEYIIDLHLHFFNRVMLCYSRQGASLITLLILIGLKVWDDQSYCSLVLNDWLSNVIKTGPDVSPIYS